MLSAPPCTHARRNGGRYIVRSSRSPPCTGAVFSPPCGEPYAAKCLHVAAIRAVAVDDAFRRRPDCIPVTNA
jgi:hypothetical protein